MDFNHGLLLTLYYFTAVSLGWDGFLGWFTRGNTLEEALEIVSSITMIVLPPAAFFLHLFSSGPFPWGTFAGAAILASIYRIWDQDRAHKPFWMGIYAMTGAVMLLAWQYDRIVSSIDRLLGVSA